MHASGDPRVRLKEIRSVSTSYHKVFYITGDLDARHLVDEPKNIEIIKIYPGRRYRLLRFFLTTPLSMLKAYGLKCDIIHIHDPELIPFAWLLSWTGASVVYDIHEDYVTSVAQKKYLPKPLNRITSKLVGAIEKSVTRNFYKVIAEKYYQSRFPSAIKILNYPILKDLLPINAFSVESNCVLYTGNVTPDRGAFLMAGFHANSDEYVIHFVGRCSLELSDKIKAVSADCDQEPPSIKGVGHFVDFSEIVRAYAEGKWLAGIAVFPDTEHYREKELTKFFEYMAVGLPIIASDFPVWKELIEGQGVGICVSPGDDQAISDALDWLLANPEKAFAMSQKGKELAKKKYSWESQAEKLTAFYEDILDQQKKRKST